MTALRRFSNIWVRQSFLGFLLKCAKPPTGSSRSLQLSLLLLLLLLPLLLLFCSSWPLEVVVVVECRGAAAAGDTLGSGAAWARVAPAPPWWPNRLCVKFCWWWVPCRMAAAPWYGRPMPFSVFADGVFCVGGRERKYVAGLRWTLASEWLFANCGINGLSRASIGFSWWGRNGWTLTRGSEGPRLYILAAARDTRMSTTRLTRRGFN